VVPSVAAKPKPEMQIDYQDAKAFFVDRREDRDEEEREKQATFYLLEVVLLGYRSG
jgi:hypothetical protein